MFGFLAPRRSIPAWRRSYARICQVQHRQFGLTTLPFLSYEATFLYQLASDLRLTPALKESSPVCCRLRRLSPETTDADTAALFCAAFGVALLGIKLDDDVQDSGRWFQHLIRWKYRRQVRRAGEQLGRLAPTLPQSMAAAIDRHAQLECSAAGIDIEDYSRPTADGFAAVFSAMCRNATCGSCGNQSDVMERVGGALGRAIIAWDCAVDFEHDRLRGNFNPLRDEVDVRRSLEYCQLQIAQMAWALPRSSVCSTVLADVAERLRRRASSVDAVSCHRRLERWGLIREQGFAYARCDCDCPCDACGDCGDAGACGDSAGCCEQGQSVGQTAGTCCAFPAAGGDFCCQGCVETCCCCCFDEQQQQQQQTTGDGTTNSAGPGPYAEFVGLAAQTDGLLNPAGYVRIDDRRIPAKTRSGEFLDSEIPVRIVGSDPYGVSVVPAEQQSPNDAAQNDG